MPRPLIARGLLGTTKESVAITLEGFDELLAKMEQLKDTVAKRIGRQAVASGTRVIRAEARRRVRVDEGNLRRSLRIKIFPIRHQGMITGRVFASRISGLQGQHAHLVEFGTTDRYHKPKELRGTPPFLAKLEAKARGLRGKYVGRMPAFPFMRPAMDTTKEQVIAKMREILGRGVDREFAKRTSLKRG